MALPEGIPSGQADPVEKHNGTGSMGVGAISMAGKVFVLNNSVGSMNIVVYWLDTK